MGAQSIFSPGGHSKVPNATGVGIVNLKLPIDYTTADGAVLHTVPTGHRYRILKSYYENLVAWTGGASSAIGASSSNPAYNTPGDIQGGSGGDLTAAMGAGFKGGSAAGAKLTGVQACVLVAGDTIKFNRITSQYTAGSGFLCVEVVEFDDGTD
jgi:hypothetical protein